MRLSRFGGSAMEAQKSRMAGAAPDAGVRLPHMQRAARILSIALMTAGVVFLVDVGLTVAYREPVSSIYGALQQNAAEGELEKIATSEPVLADLRATERVTDPYRRARLLSLRYAARTETGEPIGRITAPSMDGLDTVIIEGTSNSALQQGPGRYPGTSFPGQGRTVADRGTPDDLRSALPPHRLDERRGRDHRRDALRDLHLRGREDRDRRSEPGGGGPQRRLRAAGAECLPPALQRGRALHRVRPANPRADQRQRGEPSPAQDRVCGSGLGAEDAVEHRPRVGDAELVLEAARDLIAAAAGHRHLGGEQTGTGRCRRAGSDGALRRFRGRLRLGLGLRGRNGLALRGRLVRGRLESASGSGSARRGPLRLAGSAGASSTGAGADGAATEESAPDSEAAVSIVGIWRSAPRRSAICERASSSALIRSADCCLTFSARFISESARSESAAPRSSAISSARRRESSR